MCKQTSSMVFLVTLTFFIFAFSSSVNAMPKGIEKKSCTKVDYWCSFVPFGPPSQQVLGDIKFEQDQNCDVTIFGQLNSVLWPNWYDYKPEWNYYDIHIVTDPTCPDDSVFDLEDWVTPAHSNPHIDEPFSVTIPASSLPVPFTSLLGKFCVVAFENSLGGDDDVRGSAEIVVVP
ncbi:10280_t:CDS:1 [Ambispora leptoticha]|uniref:10280_t:CDS:1 n=1 Tax=Ambispora leptoticha TaxID=144679 RepID=A0A9N9D8F6_9GLOM|nr:10280_t:CDS:1 [Ambispora leptoticha]